MESMSPVVLWAMIVGFTLGLTLVLVETYGMFAEKNKNLTLTTKGKFVLFFGSLLASFVMVFLFMRYAMDLV